MVGRWMILSLLGVNFALDLAQDCKSPPDDKYTITMPHQGKTFTVPPLPAGGDSYSYAMDNALVAIPKKCVDQHSESITKASDLKNKQECDPQGMKYVRIADLKGIRTGGYDTLKEMASCSAGLVVGFHGSGGPGWGQVQYAAILSGLGYIHVIPDSMAMPESMGLKGKTPLKSADQITTTDYCGGYSSSEGSCGSFNKPYCFSTKLDNIVANSDLYRQYVEGVYQIRKREMDYFVNNVPNDFFSSFTKVFAVGNSEGAMVLSRYYHADFNQHLAGIIIDGWSCEFNYFVSCADNAKICGDSCDKSTPLLNLIGEDDEWFGRVSDSMSNKVAGHDSGYGASTITGNCHKAFSDQGFTNATTVVFGGTGHTPKYWNDNLVRDAVINFIGHDTFDWATGNKCVKTDGVYECPLTGAATCMPGWKINSEEKVICGMAKDEVVEEWKVRKFVLSGGTPVMTMALASAIAVGLFSLGVLMGKRVRGADEEPLASLAAE